MDEEYDYIILPVGLYWTHDFKKKLKGARTVFLVEEPIYFNPKFNQLKLIYHRASTRYYFDLLKKWGINTKYIEYSKAKKYTFLSNRPVFANDPVDHALRKKLKQHKVTLEPSLGFITPPTALAEYYSKVKGHKRQTHRSFYAWQKKRLGILTNVKSYDQENRKPMPASATVPPPPKLSAIDQRYIRDATTYVQKKVGGLTVPDQKLIFPVTHRGAVKFLLDFIRNKFKKFGDYQDFVDKDNPFLFHALISPMMNIGLLPASFVLDTIRKYRGKVKMNNYEGFVRQIIGWREYVRYMYEYYSQRQLRSNYFGNSRKLTKVWYTGQTGIEPIDNSIKVAFKYGYIHHIPRLMIMCNFMNLVGMHPKEVYRWFMEFSCDSYDWVMVPNVYGMGTFADGGLMMRKVYVSSDGYLKQMTNFPNGGWRKVWQSLYRDFVTRHRVKLKSVYGIPKNPKVSAEEKKLAAQTIRRLTK